MTPGLPSFTIVGLPDKAVTEARERVRSELSALSIALPSKRITVNLSPADLPKEGSHFDLPIAVALLAALEILPREDIERTVALGELSLDGTLVAVMGALPAAMAAAEQDRALLCPKSCGAEAAWVGATQMLAADALNEVIQHFTGQCPLTPADPGEVLQTKATRDLSDVKGQERAKRALEIAAAGRHHLLMVGSPGSGKSMLAVRLPGILPPLSPTEALETSMIHSLSGLLDEGGITRTRPFREPHHTASMAAIVGGGKGAKPGEISLAHNGVLFMDEFPEFSRPVLETLRQPIETGEVVVSRANAHVRYPCRFMLVAAANPCKCGYLADPARACARSSGLWRGLSGPHIGATDGPVRSARRSAAGCLQRPWPAAQWRIICPGGSQGARGARCSGGPFRRSAQRPGQFGCRGQLSGADRSTRSRREKAVDPGRGKVRIDGAGVSPGAAGGPHHCRSVGL